MSFGETTADGIGGQERAITLTIHNVGFAPLDIAEFRFPGTLGAFAVSDPNGALTGLLEPGNSVDIMVHLDPAQAGVFNGFLEVVSNALDSPVFRVPLHGAAFAETPTAQVDLVNSNNLGPALVDSSVAITTEVFRITNVGNQPLHVSHIRLPEGDGAFRLLDVPNNTDTQPVVLARGESFTFGAASIRCGSVWRGR